MLSFNFWAFERVEGRGRVSTSHLMTDMEPVIFTSKNWGTPGWMVISFQSHLHSIHTVWNYHNPHQGVFREVDSLPISTSSYYVRSGNDRKNGSCRGLALSKLFFLMWLDPCVSPWKSEGDNIAGPEEKLNRVCSLTVSGTGQAIQCIESPTPPPPEV